VKEERQSIQRIIAQGVPLDIAEHMVLGTDHAEIGALIMARWSLPDDIVIAVRSHHNPERITNSSTKSDMVYLSNLVCQPHVSGDSAADEFITPSSIVLDRLGIKLEQYEAFAEKIRNWIKKLSDTLTFD
jgi:HD-like signal output (HDOD) protein